MPAERSAEVQGLHCEEVQGLHCSRQQRGGYQRRLDRSLSYSNVSCIPDDFDLDDEVDGYYLDDDD